MPGSLVKGIPCDARIGLELCTGSTVYPLISHSPKTLRQAKMPVLGKSKKEMVTEFRTAVRLQRRWDTSTSWAKLRLSRGSPLNPR